FYAPTIAFPLIVREALMIEPTETESKETLDRFAHAMNAVAAEVKRDPEMVKSAPHTTAVKRVNESLASRKPVLKWSDAASTNEEAK
ncbi:MAG: aminomethyl-transferring glycine dehydrogenase subunit GcvPB, partial [Gemmatimonadetes bacterium]|nr:aminomethyl-transferring glycine dehydrogenase subunit GcvPB [Gemmatimonadota bacterium]